MRNDAGASRTTRILVLEDQQNYLDLVVKKEKRKISFKGV